MKFVRVIRSIFRFLIPNRIQYRYYRAARPIRTHPQVLLWKARHRGLLISRGPGMMDFDEVSTTMALPFTVAGGGRLMVQVPPGLKPAKEIVKVGTFFVYKFTAPADFGHYVVDVEVDYVIAAGFSLVSGFIGATAGSIKTAA